MKVKLAYNTQEHSLTGEQVPYIKELTEQEEFTRKLFGLPNSTITNGGSDMGMNEDTQVSMDTSDGDGGESAAASEIPERADEEGTEVNTSQQCGMAAAVKEGEECQEVKMSDLEGSVGEFKLNIVTCVKEEPGDDLAAVAEEGCSEPSGSEEPAALGAEALSSPRAHGQHQAHAAVEENEDALKPFESLHQEPVQSYRASSNFLQQTLTEFKMEVSQNLQRNDTVLQQHRQHLAHVSVEKNEDDLKPLESLHLERVQSSEIYQATSKFLQQALTEFKMEVKLVHNTQDFLLTGGWVPYINTMNDTQLSMDTSDGDGGESAAAFEISERADEEGTEVNTSQQCGMAVAVEEGEECQEGKMSDLEGSVDELKLNIVVCVKKEACDELSAVVEGGRSESSGGEKPVTLRTGVPPYRRACGQHQAHGAGEENEDDLKPLERLYEEQVQSTESYQATSQLLLQTLTEFKTEVSQNLQRNSEILQQQNEVLRQQNEILQHHLQRNNAILQQQNEVLFQLLQRSNETLNEMRQILYQTVALSGQQQPSAETSAAGHSSGT
ncbi:hypothetical protein scyTo_0009663 [Scyliorhinus torazame]|uniref:Uncharacterized protein n=1 Tax=Scyliorhinus torazame TaxID=75743 RepID=A0A401NR88_SCYTO|nr:hypothetical protein [Scyliorhinus torazame]